MFFLIMAGLSDIIDYKKEDVTVTSYPLSGKCRSLETHLRLCSIYKGGATIREQIIKEK